MNTDNKSRNLVNADSDFETQTQRLATDVQTHLIIIVVQSGRAPQDSDAVQVSLK